MGNFISDDTCIIYDTYHDIAFAVNSLNDYDFMVFRTFFSLIFCCLMCLVHLCTVLLATYSM